MMTCRDDAGGSLTGAIDGSNTTYSTALTMRLDRVVDVYVNGLCRMAALDNGYFFADARTLVLKDALLPGDTLSVRYNASPAVVGVPGAQPAGLHIEPLEALGPLSAVEIDTPTPIVVRLSQRDPSGV